jgi:hypothetical protein
MLEVPVTTTTEDRTVASGTQDGLGTASLVLGILGFLPIPGVMASILAIVLGAATHLSGTNVSAAAKQRATIGIILGAVSVLILATICIIYFGILGYPLPHIEHYRPESPQ